MAWRQNSFGAALLSIALLVGCSGGQTGQPTSGHCVRAVRIDEPVEGISAQALLDSCSGEHTATLHWSSGSPIPMDQEITITITIAPAQLENKADSCARMLLVPIDVNVASSDGQLVEHGIAQLAATFGALQPATFSFVGERYSVSATLRGAPGNVNISGSLESLPDAGVDGSATFSSADGSADTGDQ